MHAIGNKIIQNNPNTKVLYVTSEQFINELINSIKTKLMILDNDIKIYPGHMESSDIGYERLRNPFLQDEFDIF